MFNLKYIFSDITCGEACWTAKQDECKCSCGGKNHGIKLRGELPDARLSRVKGIAYKLISAGKWNQGYALAAELNRISTRKVKSNYDPEKHYDYKHTEEGAPARLFSCTESQAKWQELETILVTETRSNVGLVWLRIDEDISPEQIEAIQLRLAEERAAYQTQKQTRDQANAERTERIDQQKAILYQPLSALPDYDPTKHKRGVKVTHNTERETVFYKFVRVTGKGTFGRLKAEYAFNTTLEPPNADKWKPFRKETRPNEPEFSGYKAY